MIKTLKHLRFMLVMLMAFLGVNVAFGATATFSASDLSTNPKTKDGITCTMASSITVGNQQIWKNGSSAVKADVIQIGNSANQNQDVYYFEITSANEITGVTFKAVNNQSGTSYSIPVVYWTGAVAAAFQGYEMVSLAPKDAAVEPADQSLTIPSGTKTVRFYRTIRTNAAYTEFSGASGYKTLGDGKTAYIISLEVTTATASTPHTVTFNANGGTCGTSSLTEASAGAGVTLPSATPADEDTQEFKGWAVSSTETDPTKIFAAGAKYEPKEDVTLYAIYGAKTVKSAIVYANTKEASTAALPTQYTEGVGIAEFAALEDVTGFHFTGWNPSSISASATGEQTITAEWTKAPRTMFSLEMSSSVANQNISKDDSPIELTSSYATITGGKAYVGNKNADATKMQIKNKNLYYNGNDGYVILELDEEIHEGDVISFTNNQSSSNQIVFTTTETRTADIITVDGSYTIPAESPLIGASTIYVWRYASGTYVQKLYIKTLEDYTPVVKHHVTYAKGDAAVTGTLPTQADVKEGGKFTVADKGDLAWDGYDFDGWNDGSADYAAGATYTMGTADVTLTAKWKAACTVETPTISGEAEGYPSVVLTAGNVTDGATLQWYKDEVEISGANDVTYTATESGSYTVKATKGCEKVSEAKVVTIVNPLGAHTLTWTVNVNTSAQNSPITIGSKSSSSLVNALAAFGRNNVTIDNTTKAAATGKISTTAEKDETKYIYTTFKVADGYAFSLSKVTMSVVAVTTAKTMEVELSDSNGEKASVTYTQAKNSDPAAHDYAFSDLKLSGTVTIKVYGYGATDAYRLGTPITINGTVEPYVVPTKHHVTYAKGEATCEITLPTQADVKENGTFNVADAVACDGLNFLGWNDGTTTYAAGATYTMGTADVTLTAQWEVPAVSWTVTYNANGGTCATPSATWTGADALVLPAAEFTGKLFDGWFDSEDNLIGKAGAEYTPTADIELIAHYSYEKILRKAVFSNSFEAWIDENAKTATVYYLEGETAPTYVEGVASGECTISMSEGKLIVKDADEATVEYVLTMTAVTPATVPVAKITPTTEAEAEVSWIKNNYGWASDKGWKFAKTGDAADWSRRSNGNNHVYLFVGACENVLLTWKVNRAIKVYRNGVEVTATTADGVLTIPGDINNASMIKIASNQNSGDGGFSAVEVLAHVVSTDATLKTLKYGETPITLVAEQFTYSVELPWNTTAVPALAAETNDANATKVITDATAFVEKAATSTVVVTAEDGTTTKTYTVNYTIADHYVAQIGETKYTTLEAAVAAATAGQTVKLLEDVDLAATLVVDKQMTLDLNGKKIFNTVDLWELTPGAWSLISVRGEGNLTITGNGTLDAKADDCYALDVQDENAKLTIENGTFNGNIHAVYVYAGLATINGGKYDIYQKSTQYAGDPNAFLLNCYDANRANGTAKIVINDGIFVGFNPSDNKAEGAATDFCPQGYAGEDLGDGTFGVKRVYTFDAWDGTSATFTKAGEWTIYSVDGNGVPQATTKFDDDQQVDKTDATIKANALVDRRFAVKFDKEVKSINFRAYAGNNNRTLLSIKESAQMPTAKASYTDVTAKYELINGTLATDRDYNYTINGHFEADKYYLIDVNNGSINFYDFFYTESKVASHAVTTITEVKINGEALDATELAAFVANKGMTLPKTDAAFNVRATDIVKDIYDDGFEQVLATNETYTTAAPEGDNFVATLDINEETYTVTAPKMADPVAKIGTTAYETLAEAVAAAENGDEIVMLADVDLTATGLTVDKEVVLNLNGHNIKAGESATTNIQVTGKLTVEDNSAEANGKIYTEAAYSSANKMGVVRVNGGEFILNSGNIEAVLADAANNGQFGVVAANGATITINGGQIKAGWYAIASNGNDASTLTVVVNGGELISTADYAIYQPAKNMATTIENGVVYGATGAIAANAGVVTVNGGTITSKGQGSTGTWGDGTGGLTNAAININAKYGNTTCAITGGKIIAEGDAVTMNTGAQFTATIAVSGGAFSSVVPAEYCAEGYEPVTTPNAQGLYEVEVQETILDIEGDMTFNFVGAVDAQVDGANDGTYKVLASYAGVKAQANGLYVAADFNKITAGDKANLQGKGLKFHTTVPCFITVEFSNTGSKTNYRELYVNGVATGAKSKTTGHVTYTQFVEAGDVVLTAFEETATWNMLNFYKITFAAATEVATGREAGRMYTYCPAQNVAAGMIEGAEFFVPENFDGFYVNLIKVDELTAGYGYVMIPTASTVYAAFNGEVKTTAVAASAATHGMQGFLSANPSATLDIDDTNDNNLVIISNHLYYANNNWLTPGKAYICLDIVKSLTGDPSNVAPRRRVGFAGNATTGMEMFEATEDMQKLLINGQLYIIRGGKTFNAAGLLVK